MSLFFWFSISRPGISHWHMKLPRITNVQHPTKTHCMCVCVLGGAGGGGRGGGRREGVKKCNKQFVSF